MYGAADFFGGLATRKSPVLQVLILSQAAGLLVALGGAALLGGWPPAAADLLWGAAAGLCGALGLAALYQALATTVVAVASPVAAVAGAVLPVAFGLLLGERPALPAWVGIAVALPALVLLTASPAGGGKDPRVGRAAVLGLAAGLGFGLFFVALSRTSSRSGLWPLVGARCSTIGVAAVSLLLSRRSRPWKGSFNPATALAGVLDMGANIAFLLASRAGMLTIAAVVASLYPAPTVLLARLVLRERLSPLRVIGLALAVAGVALISAG